LVLKVRGLKVTRAASIALMLSDHDRKLQEKFGARVRALRKREGLSQEALALSCGLDRSYVGGVERGERNISLVNIHAIAKALGVPVRDLFNK
jgi:DNA-binding XRE family transcriptional regulator